MEYHFDIIFNIPFVDAVKFTRNAARDLFSLRYKGEKMLNHS